MKKITTSIQDLFIIENKFIFQDERGCFYETWNNKNFTNINLKKTFVQDNISISKKHVIRGLHLQSSAESQLKLAQVVKGKVLDVIVDLRKESATFGKHEKIFLDSIEKKMIWIPEGCAHGFLTLEDDTVFLYKCSKHYKASLEITLNWNDPDLKINWGIKNPIISKKDRAGISFQNFLKL